MHRVYEGEIRQKVDVIAQKALTQDADKTTSEYAELVHFAMRVFGEEHALVLEIKAKL